MARAHDEHEEGGSTPEPGRPERPRLRRSAFGYRRADVDEALDARDGELAELRQDVAALWLAFAQHDRVLRSLSADAAPAPPPPPAPPPEAEPGPPPEEVAAEATSIGDQLSELDEVLAAIEMATQTLERTYAEEIRGAGRPEGESEQPPDDADAEPRA